MSDSFRHAFLQKGQFYSRHDSITMEQHALKNANNCMNTNIHSYLETSGGQSSYPYLNVAHCLNTGAD